MPDGLLSAIIVVVQHTWIRQVEAAVVEEGAYSDLLLINGNPLEDILILTRIEENIALIMKEGKMFKNIL